MANARELALIKSVIADGFDNLEAISFEMDIPMDVLLNLKRQVELEKKEQIKRNATRRLNFEKEKVETRSKTYQKLGELRRNYELVYNGIDINKKPKELPALIPDNKVVEPVIEQIEDSLVSIKDRRARINKVLKELDSIKNEQISLDQAEKIVNILVDKDRFPIPEGDNDKTLRYMFNMYRGLMIKKLIAAVRNKAELTNDLEELKGLNRILSLDIEKNDYLGISPIKRNIQQRISKLEAQKRDYEMENNFSEDILKILSNLISSNPNEEEIDQAIDNEVQRRINSNTNRFPGVNTPERQKTQVYYRVAKAMEKLAEEYPIQRADKVIEILEKKFGMGFDVNFRSVMSNYMVRNEFIAAGYLCDRYSGMLGNDSKSASVLTRAKSDITRHEIGQLILKGIQTNATDEEQNKFFDVIERRMKNHMISYSLIPLGRTKDGMKKITLQDIWGEDIDKKR